MNKHTSQLVGSGLGLVSSLLLNRYLLGNKSIGSNLLAGAVGAGLGYAGGNIWDRYKQMQGIREDRNNVRINLQNRLAELEEHARDPHTDLSSPDVAKSLHKQMASIMGGDDNYDRDGFNAYMAAIAKDKLMQRFKNNPLELERIGGDYALIPINSDVASQLDRFAVRFRSSNPVRIEEELKYGMQNTGDYPDDDAMMKDLLATPLGLRAAGGDQKTLAALRNYHNKLFQIVSSDVYNNKLPENARTPEIADYLALRAMPEQQRKLVPLMHRLASTGRAKATKGWSYEFDYQTMVEPKYFKEATRWAALPDQIFDSVNILSTVAPGANIPLLVGSLANLGINTYIDKTLPAWKYEDFTRNGDGFFNGYKRNRVIQELRSPLSGIPIYPWQASELAMQHKISGYLGALSTVADAGVDINRIIRSVHKMPGWAAKLAKKNKKLRPAYNKIKNSGFAPAITGTNYASSIMNGLGGAGAGVDLLQGYQMSNPDFIDTMDKIGIDQKHYDDAMQTPFRAIDYTWMNQ